MVSSAGTGFLWNKTRPNLLIRIHTPELVLCLMPKRSFFHAEQSKETGDVVHGRAKISLLDMCSYNGLKYTGDWEPASMCFSSVTLIPNGTNKAS